MKIWQNEAGFIPDHPITEEIFTESTLFLDIETTGFSPLNTHIYLIGCASRRGSSICITQFFAENPQEEKSILNAFLTLISQYDNLISYNGLGFDMPYLRKRLTYHGLNDKTEFPHLDLYREISRFKSLLKLPDLKQKSIEAFLGIERNDKYSGGDLIKVYSDYVTHPCEDHAKLLQLHNYEDLLGMPGLLPILSYSKLFEGNFEVVTCEKNAYRSYENEQELELILTLIPDAPLPKRFSSGSQDIYLTGYDKRIKLKIPIYQGKLKFFYQNYKDYYYLPEEDRAIHKSVAFYVDKNFRTKAKAATCYSKKTGCFLPQYEEIMNPCFKLEYQDKITWFELTEEFTDSPEFQKAYALHLLKKIL